MLPEAQKKKLIKVSSGATEVQVCADTRLFIALGNI